MPSALSTIASRIPYKHSTARPPPRDATSSPSSHAPDVISTPHLAPSTPIPSSSATTTSAGGLATDTTLDSQTKTAPSIKSRSHSRLASLGRIRSRGSIQHHPHPAQKPQGETVPPRIPEVSPLRAASHKRPETLALLSNSSSESTLSDKSDAKSLEDYPSRASFWLATASDFQRDYDSAAALEHYQRLAQNKPRMMHQTSSKLLRMTDDERPFTRDFKDLFSTLMVSLPLTPHRVRFTRIEHTFTTEEAMTNLGSLKFSQSNRMPDPKDPSRIVTTTTTTTFSMAKEMARSVCHRFLEARFVESVEGKTDFNSKSSVWQLTPKGMCVLGRFCNRNGIHQRHVNELLDSARNMMQLVILERETDTDKIMSDASTINVIFRRFAGDAGPNLKSNSTASDSDSLNDYATGLVGVRMQRARRGDKDSPYVFTGKSGFDWLMNCCTLVDKREVFELANFFMSYGLIEPASEDRSAKFVASKHSMYAVTQKGMRAAGWITEPNGAVNGEATAQQRLPQGVSRDSNTNRMTVIVRDPALRLLFREYLSETHCEENLAFYVEVQAFLSEYERAKRNGAPPKLDLIRETLASAYSLYNAFLAPGSPCELNIDHNLRNALASRMTRAVGEDEQMLHSLDEVAMLFDQAQSSVFKLMASDSVPKFFREPKYAAMLRERNLESLINNFAAASVS
ncbi:uncharacterized protein LTR77_004536 [Saxophila tyrrhenica]|uniref:RGS-domain-containing protein n=1 Tax=Saxophila tyrrhenica TaxID=1690608 RepID=A0AAV9PD20_9PEZI|nr:hypothetical protein LTR77_004536 [Saxophila tyrrhenica]